ncbi:hypothetical protein KH990_02605 [Methanoculleus bourgensis]|nr:MULTISPECIES: hypothetical protein [Methanoculleus]MBT0732269.1 hypothetical protein [Methanoculleus bourgensis]NMA87841.1 hypothetical protein [Methanoculleus bourgensis]
MLYIDIASPGVVGPGGVGPAVMGRAALTWEFSLLLAVSLPFPCSVRSLCPGIPVIRATPAFCRFVA